MKFIICLLILFFMIALPLSQLKYNYYVYQTFANGVVNKGLIIKKTDYGYSSRSNHYIYVSRQNQEIRIRVSSSFCNKKNIGDVVEYKFIEGNDFGVYKAGLYAPANFFASIITIILGIVFLYYTAKQK